MEIVIARLTEIVMHQQAIDEQMVKELESILERDRLALEGLRSLSGAMSTQNELNREILAILERHDLSLRFGWFVRLVLLPFSFVSAGVGLRTAWDKYKWKEKLQALFRRDGGSRRTATERTATETPPVPLAAKVASVTLSE